MEEKKIVEGNFNLELKEAKTLDLILEESTPLSITEKYGGVYTIFCC